MRSRWLLVSWHRGASLGIATCKVTFSFSLASRKPCCVLQQWSTASKFSPWHPQGLATALQLPGTSQSVPVCLLQWRWYRGPDTLTPLARLFQKPIRTAGREAGLLCWAGCTCCLCLSSSLRVWINKTRFENQVREWTGKLSPAQDLWVFVTHWPPPGTCHALAGRAEGCSPLGLSHCPTCLTAALGSHASPPPVHAREWGCPQLWFSLRLCFLVLLLSGLPGL